MHWKRQVAKTRALGDDWLVHGTEVALVVPSSVIQESDNVLIAPDHLSDRPGTRLVYNETYTFDARLLAG